MIFRLAARFSLAQLLTWTIPLVSAIVLSGVANASEWVGVSLGMALGAAASLFVSGGWSLQGASELIAGKDNANQIILTSSVQRLLSFALVLPLLAIGCQLLLQSEFLICFLSACSSAAIGAGPRWHLSATGKVGRLILLDILPRVTAGLLAIGVLVLHGSVLAFTAIVLIGQIAPIITSISDRRAWLLEIRKWNISKYFYAMKHTGYSTTAEMISALSVASPIVIASLVLEIEENSEVATAMRIFGLALTAVTILSNSSQSASVLESEQGRVKVVKQNLRISILLAIAGFAGLAFFAQSLSAILFPKFQIQDNAIFVLFGLAFFAMTISTHFLRHVVLFNRMYLPVLAANASGLFCAFIAALLLLTSASFSATTVVIPYVFAEWAILISILLFARIKKA